MAALAEQQKTVRTTGIWVRLSTPLLFAAVVLPLIGRLYLSLFEAAGGVVVWASVAAIMIEALPPLILAWTMFGVVSVLSEYEMARYVSLKASQGLKRAGTGATVALVLQVLVVPVALAALKGQPLWPTINPNVFDLAVMIFASSMLTVGSVLEAAARELQSEVDQMV
ncbi:MAG: hypothetical protein SGI91_16745 [Alphaproteobacteria bacterium]|nr:hypothetical protein [Alphaproteobacteria bacterium]